MYFSKDNTIIQGEGVQKKHKFSNHPIFMCITPTYTYLLLWNLFFTHKQKV